jgi:hypothetical protein
VKDERLHHNFNAASVKHSKETRRKGNIPTLKISTLWRSSWQVPSPRHTQEIGSTFKNLLCDRTLSSVCLLICLFGSVIAFCWHSVFYYCLICEQNSTHVHAYFLKGRFLFNKNLYLNKSHWRQATSK